jgi:hypothetical protein
VFWLVSTSWNRLGLVLQIEILFARTINMIIIDVHTRACLSFVLLMIGDAHDRGFIDRETVGNLDSRPVDDAIEKKWKKTHVFLR